MKKLITILLICLFILALVSGCAENETVQVESPQTFNPEDWVGKRISILSGSWHSELIEQYIPGAEAVYETNLVNGIVAMQSGKVDAILGDDAMLRKMKAQTPGLRLLEPFVTTDEFGVIVYKENTELLAELNEFIALIKSDGTYDDMVLRWLDTDEPPPIPEIPNGSGEILKFGTTDLVEGFAYIRNGELTGFDIEFARRFAAYADRDLDISGGIEPGALIMGVSTGTYDFASSLITITEERKSAVNFTDPYYEGGAAVAVLDATESGEQEQGFLGSIITAVERNLIQENRWMMVVDGLRVSMTITLLAFVLATLLGFGVCALRMSKNPILRSVGSVYVTILRGTPIVVLLMITFYVIFARSSISGVMVAVIAFGANGAAFIGEIVRSAIMTVDKGQVEAARSMGFSKAGAFFNVTFPQAVRVGFPVYMSEFISTFKMTSVVGYIAIVDLTKAGDIIRSRTYDAFFPLIMVAVVYLIVASAMIWLFNLINRKTDKRLKRG